MEAMFGRRRGSVVAALWVAVALLAGGGVIGVATIDTTEPSALALDPAAVVQADPTPPQSPQELTPLISPSPGGYDQTTQPIDGAVTKDQLAELRGGSNREALALFDQLELQNGFVRTWRRTGADDLLAVRLYQFSKPSGALKYAELGAAARPDATRFEVAGVPGATGIDAGVDADGRHLLFVFAPKGRVVAVVAASLRDPPDLASVNALARSQHALLP